MSFSVKVVELKVDKFPGDTKAVASVMISAAGADIAKINWILVRLPYDATELKIEMPTLFANPSGFPSVIPYVSIKSPTLLENINKAVLEAYQNGYESSAR